MEAHYIVIFAVIINSIWWIWYIINTLKWKTKPNKITWLIWAAAPLIWTAATVVSQWFIWSVLPVFIAGLIPLTIFLASFINKNSYWKLWKLDYWCLALAIFALILWFITSQPLLAIIFWILADFLASIPLLIKIYKYPETETVWTFVIWLIANASAFLVIKNWVLEEYLFPLYLVLICFVIIFTYFWKKLLNFR